MHISDIHVIVLAAGLSRRMGNDNKLLLAYSEHTIIEETISQIISAGFKYITVVVGHDNERLNEILSKNPLFAEKIDVVVNPSYDQGQVSSLKQGIENLNQNCIAFMVALGDMPLIQGSDYMAFAENFIAIAERAKCISRPISQKGMMGNPVLFSAVFKHDILQNEDKESSQSVVKNNKEYLSFFITEQTCFYHDIDTPDDYEKLISLGS